MPSTDDPGGDLLHRRKDDGSNRNDRRFVLPFDCCRNPERFEEVGNVDSFVHSPLTDYDE